MSKKYLIQTFGCQMNVHESEKIAGMLKNLGFDECQDVHEADVVVFNTCCIRESAELKIMSKIGELKAIKKQNKNLVIIVCGCMTQQKGMAETLRKKFPFVSIICGTHNVNKIEEYLSEFLTSRKKKNIVWSEERQIDEMNKIYRTSGKNAWVNIMFGCNNFCTYCIVPYVRGRERSRSVENIVAEVEKLAKSGEYQTITLLGQNVNSYGNDFQDGKTNFVYLLSKLCEIEGDFKIKFLSSHPKDFSPELIDFIATNPKMSRAIHLPVQSGSTDVLTKMNRRYTAEHYKNLVQEIYKKIPDASLTTDIIVGFPGETDKDFELTLDLIKFCKFSGVFGFVYSKRKGTPAEKFYAQVDRKTKQKRITALFDLQHQIQQEEQQKMVGKTFDVTFEKDEKSGKIFAFTDSGKSIQILNAQDVNAQKGRAKVECVKLGTLCGVAI